jgi:hypothetical protein
MHVDWYNKWMSISVGGQLVQLHGLQPLLHVHSVVELFLVTPIDSDGSFSCLTQQEIPTPIQQLLLSSDQLFQEPQG